MPFQATVVQKKLEQAGFDSKLAYGIAAVLESDVVGDLEDRLVTRDYFDARIAELDARMAKFEARIETRLAGFDVKLAGFDVKLAGFDVKLAEQKTELIKWMVGLTAGSTLTIILTLLRLVK